MSTPLPSKRIQVPGYLRSPEASQLLGLTELQFRKVAELIPYLQLHERGSKLFREEDLQAFLESFNG